MKRVWEWVGTWQFVVVVAVPSMALTTYTAFQGERTSIMSLAFFAFIWGAMALFLGWLLKEANQTSMSAIKGWTEQEQLTLDLTHLLAESLDNLATWDRETADEIADRTNTVIRMRFQNFEERNHP